MRRVTCFKTDLGDLGVAEEDGRITNVYLPGGAPYRPTVEGGSPVLLEAGRQIRGYLAGERRAFELPLGPEGSPFATMVWKALSDIPYGELRCYSSIASTVVRPGGARAVGQACHANPIPLIVPCHRVIGKGGRLTGYAGGLDLKRDFLEMERRHAGA